MSISLTNEIPRFDRSRVENLLSEKEDGLYLFSDSVDDLFFIVKFAGKIKFGQYLEREFNETSPLDWEGYYLGKLALTLEKE